MPAKVFISYTGRDDLSKTISKAVFDHLKDVGFAVWRDEQRLIAGEVWHEQLVRSLMGTHSGVLLLTPEALESEWVLKEATYLSIRSRGAREFKLLCFLLPGVGPDDLSRGDFKALQLPETQMIQCPPDDVPERAATDLNEVKALWDEPHGEESLIRRIEELLLRGGRDLSILLELARDLELDLADWFPDSSLRRVLARELARHAAERQVGDVAVALGRQAPSRIDLDTALEILRYLDPFHVDRRAARRLRNFAESKPPPAVVGLNADRQDTSLLYLRLSSGELAAWDGAELDEATDGESDSVEIPRAVRRALGEALCGDADATDEKIREDLQALATPFVIELPGPLEDSVLRDLRRDFGSACFLFFYGGLDDKVPMCRTGTVELLRPPLAAGREGEIHRSIISAKTTLNRRFRRANR